MAIDWKNVKENTQIRVVFYGRVSTEHEMQLDAFNNQTLWYYDRLDQNKNWILAKPVETYLDKGITGTQAKVRPGFMKMIEDAEKGIFDMVVTRDVSRFGRNTLDMLEYTRKLKSYNVQVYFVNDGIRTLQDKDAELRLTFLASFAQEESGKISERVRAGQHVSRKNGVIYGSGNILGYDRIRKVGDGNKRDHLGDTSMPTFAINPEQAETVRRIYDLYEQGYGLRRIKNTLMQEKRKNSSGSVSWEEHTISNILENPMYIGKQRQHNTVVTDFLTGKKETIPREERTLAQGDFEPILSVEQFERVQEMRLKKRKENPESPFGKGGRETLDKWVDKLECACGSRFRKYTWAKRKDGSENIGYNCVNRTRNGSLEFQIAKGIITPEMAEMYEVMEEIEVVDENGVPIVLDIGDACSMKGVPSWYLELMAKKVFTYLTGAHFDEILRTLEGIAGKYLEETEKAEVDIGKLQAKIQKQQTKLDRLLDLYTDEAISKEEYLKKRVPLTDEMTELQNQLKKAQSPEENEKQKEALEEAMEKIKKAADFSNEIAPDFLKQYVDKIVVRSNFCFEWMINVHGDAVEFLEENHKIAAAKLSEKRKFTRELQETKYDARFTDVVNFDEARKFRKAQGTYLRPNQWDDLLMVVYVRN